MATMLVYKNNRVVITFYFVVYTTMATNTFCYLNPWRLSIKLKNYGFFFACGVCVADISSTRYPFVRADWKLWKFIFNKGGAWGQTFSELKMKAFKQ